MQPATAGPRARNLNLTKRSQKVIEYRGKRVINMWQPTLLVEEVRLMRVFFDDIERELLGVLAEYAANKVVVGCVAWLSNPRIIRALSRCHYLLLLVNDEDYSQWGGGRVPALYSQLPVSTQAPADVFAYLESPLNLLETGGYDPVRALGGSNGNALMHSKYLVFLDRGEELAPGGYGVHRWSPIATWTGSFNFTKNASCNQENAQFIVDVALAKGYFYDFANSFIHSRPVRTGTPAT